MLRLMRSVGFGDLEITTDPAGTPPVVMADCTTRYNWRKIFDFSAKGLSLLRA